MKCGQFVWFKLKCKVGMINRQPVDEKWLCGTDANVDKVQVRKGGLPPLDAERTTLERQRG